MSILLLMIASSLTLFKQSLSFQIQPTLRTAISNISRKSTLNSSSKFFLQMSTNSESVDVHVASNLKYVQDRITKCVQDCNRAEGSVNLVAVSKTKPSELLMDAYNVSAKIVENNSLLHISLSY